MPGVSQLRVVLSPTKSALRASRQLARLLVAGIVIEDKPKGEAPRVRITYRFDEPEVTSDERGGELCEVSRNTNEFLEAKAGR